MNRFDFYPGLIVYDFDGVMTDNRAFTDENGNEGVFVHRGDGYGVRMIKDSLKIPQIILSTEEAPVVLQRAKKLHIPAIYNAGDAKSEILKRYCLENSIEPDTVMYLGNDLNDLQAMLMCGYKTCPSDAEPEIIDIADYVFSARGGHGVIRELYRILSKEINDYE